MAEKISDEKIEYTAVLAKLELNEEEKKAAKSDMEKMLQYIDKLNELDTEGIEPLAHVFETVNVFREDIEAGSGSHEDVLSNAKERKGRCFAAPKTFA